MKASTVAALERINRDFYTRRAAEFSDTRKQPWPGWQRVLAIAREHIDTRRISILDLGCGNGRFRAELASAFGSAGADIVYLGIDASLPLLALARSGASPECPFETRLIAGDLVRRPLDELGTSARFDLILNFGVMHHVPSRAARGRLLAASARLLRPGGLLAVSFWQFGDRMRFRRRALPWRERPELGVDEADLEAGDHLLSWGDAGELRYCHYADPQEAGELVSALGLEPLASFSDDGRTRDLNLYHLLRQGTQHVMSE